MGTGLWHDGADQHMFHCLFIPTFARCLSVLVESPFLHQGYASSSYNGGTQLSHNGVARGDIFRENTVYMVDATTEDAINL